MALRTVLIVDGDHTRRARLVAGMRDCGWAVLEASKPDDAVDCMLSHSISMALVDLMLPGVKGIRLVRLLHELRPHMPVVVASGYRMNDKQARRVAGNVIAFVPQPVAVPDLVALSVCPSAPPLPPAQAASA